MLRIQACFVSLSFAGLVVLARSLNPIPSRTRPLNSSAPMVLCLKTRESRSLPDLPRTNRLFTTTPTQHDAALTGVSRRVWLWGPSGAFKAGFAVHAWRGVEQP